MENDDNMSKNFDFYVEHQSELAKKYNGEYIVIVDRKVVGHFAKLEEAFEFANKKYHPGEFLYTKLEMALIIILRQFQG